MLMKQQRVYDKYNNRVLNKNHGIIYRLKERKYCNRCKNVFVSHERLNLELMRELLIVYTSNTNIFRVVVND